MNQFQTVLEGNEMENIQGTPTVQVNSQISQSGFVSAVEGSAFAAVNSPVNPERVGLTPGEPVTMVDHTGTKASAVVVHEMMTAAQRPRRAIASLPVCAVVTVRNADWRPTKLSAIPKSLTEGMGMSLSAHFAMVYNQSDMARFNRRWAVVTTRGTVLILSGIPEADRPTNPADFPPCVQAGLSHDQAVLAADEANAPRFALAAVPREWTIALRRADCTDERMKGGGH